MKTSAQGIQMNRLLFLFLIPIFLQTAQPSNAEVAAYRALMDHAQDLQDGLLDAFEGKDAKAVARQASELTALLQADVQYWEAAKIAKAAELGKGSVRLF